MGNAVRTAALGRPRTASVRSSTCDGSAAAAAAGAGDGCSRAAVRTISSRGSMLDRASGTGMVAGGVETEGGSVRTLMRALPFRDI